MDYQSTRTVTIRREVETMSELAELIAHLGALGLDNVQVTPANPSGYIVFAGGPNGLRLNPDDPRLWQDDVLAEEEDLRRVAYEDSRG